MHAKNKETVKNLSKSYFQIPLELNLRGLDYVQTVTGKFPKDILHNIA